MIYILKDKDVLKKATCRICNSKLVFTKDEVYTHVFSPWNKLYYIVCPKCKNSVVVSD